MPVVLYFQERATEILYLPSCSFYFLFQGVLISLREAGPLKDVATLWSTEEGEHLLANTEGWEEGTGTATGERQQMLEVIDG